LSIPLVNEYVKYKKSILLKEKNMLLKSRERDLTRLKEQFHQVLRVAYILVVIYIFIHH